MKLLIIRHAEPDYSVDSLTEKGFKEAEFLSERLITLPIDDVYVSALGRAKDTAKPYLLKSGKKAEICDWLVEFPAYIIDPDSGKKRIPWDFLPGKWTKYDKFFDKSEWINEPVMTTGNVKEKYDYVIENLDRVLEKYGYVRDGYTYKVNKEYDGTVAFFCHFGLECVLLSHLLNVSPIVLWQGFMALPSSVTTLITEEREKDTAYFRCNAFGDISHLYVNKEKASFAGRFCELYSNENERH